MESLSGHVSFYFALPCGELAPGVLNALLAPSAPEGADHR